MRKQGRREIPDRACAREKQDCGEIPDRACACEKARGAGKYLTALVPVRKPGRSGNSAREFSRPLRKERGSGERKQHLVSRLSPYRRAMEHFRSQTCPRELVLARHRRRGAEMRRVLSAKKREESSYFRGSTPTGPHPPSSSAQPTTQPGTGTLPDAGGTGGGGHAPRLSPTSCDDVTREPATPSPRCRREH